MIDPANDPVLASTRFHVTAVDVAAANRKHMRWQARRGRSWAWLLGFTLICTIVVSATTPNGWSPISMTATAAGVFTLMIVWYAIVYAAMPVLGRRAMTTQPNLRHEWRVDLDERGMRAVTPNQDNFVAWADYVGWSEDARILLVYQGERMFQMIPTRGLAPSFIDIFHQLVADIPRR